MKSIHMFDNTYTSVSVCVCLPWHTDFDLIISIVYHLRMGWEGLWLLWPSNKTVLFALHVLNYHGCIHGSGVFKSHSRNCSIEMASHRHQMKCTFFNLPCIRKWLFARQIAFRFQMNLTNACSLYPRDISIFWSRDVPLMWGFCRRPTNSLAPLPGETGPGPPPQHSELPAFIKPFYFIFYRFLWRSSCLFLRWLDSQWARISIYLYFSPSPG